MTRHAFVFFGCDQDEFILGQSTVSQCHCHRVGQFDVKLYVTELT